MDSSAENGLHQKVPVRRLQWIFTAVLIFFGIFAASTLGPVPSHVPQCAGARAIGAQSSLASTKRDTLPPVQKVQPVLPDATVIEGPIVLTKLIQETAPVRLASVGFERYSAALFRRPPPQVS